MKTDTDIIVTQVFKPVRLIITIESFEEHKLLRALFSANERVPKMLLKEKEIADSKTLEQIMQQCFDSLLVLEKHNPTQI